jgi:putative cell wall-binding protein
LIASVLALVAAPAAAITPSLGDTTTKANARVSGVDRYDTAGKAADAYLGRRGLSGWNSIVLVSGDNFPDALAASSLAGALTAPIIMIPSDGSLPSKVRDWAVSRRVTIQANSTAAASFKVYVVGGTAAVPQAGVDALVAVLADGDSTPATSVRISGADRYATAAAVANLKNAAGSYVVLDSADTLFLASGTSFADALAASPHLFNASDPVLLTPSDSLSADAKAVMKTWKTLGGSSVVILGGTSAVSDAVIDDILDQVGLAQGTIRRVWGADRYATSVAINDWIITNNGNFNGKLITLVNGQTYADGLAGAPFMGHGGGNAAYLGYLVESGALPASVSTKIGKLSATGGPSHVYVLGGTSAVGADVVTAASTTAKAIDGAAVATLTCVELNTSGATNITLSITGNLTAAGAGATSEIGLINAAQFTINGISSSIAATSAWGDTNADGTEDTAPTYSAVTGKTSGIMSVPANSLDAGDVITWSGLSQTANTATIDRAIAGTSCTVANDAVGPSATITAVVGGSDTCDIAGGGTGGAGSPCATANTQTASFKVNFSEAITASTFTIADINGGTTPGAGTVCKDEYDVAAAAGVAGGNSVAAEISAVGVAGSSFLVRTWIADADTAAEDGQACVIEAGETISIVTTGITDRSTNAGTLTKTKTLHAVLDADVTGATLTTTTTCTQSSHTILKRGILTATATATGSAPGVTGNTYTMAVVNSRGMRTPTVAVNSTTKVITVTADLAYTTTEDIAMVATNNGVVASWAFGRSGGSALDKIGTASATIANVGFLSAGATAGVQSCTVKLTANEQMRAEVDAGVTLAIVFGGAQIAAASALAIANTTVTSGAIAPALPVTAASISWTLSAAVTDSKGNASGLAGTN